MSSGGGSVNTDSWAFAERCNGGGAMGMGCLSIICVSIPNLVGGGRSSHVSMKLRSHRIWRSPRHSCLYPLFYPLRLGIIPTMKLQCTLADSHHFRKPDSKSIHEGRRGICLKPIYIVPLSARSD